MKIGLIHCEGDFKKSSPFDYEGRKNIGDAVEIALNNLKMNYIKIPANKKMFKSLEKNRVDLIFNSADEGFNMNTHLEAQIPAFLDMLNIPYTGSNYLTLGLCNDKIKTKEILKANGLPTPNFLVIKNKISENFEIKGIKFPLIIKPSKEDGSIGIKIDSVVNTKKEMIKKINEVLEKYNQPVLVEEFIEGREIYIGILGRDKLEVLPPTEIKFNLPKGYKNFLPYEAKWEENSSYYKGTIATCPAKIEQKLFSKLKDAAIKSYKIFNVRDYGRIDFRIDKKGKIFILEVNPNPDLSRESGIALMAKRRGMEFEDLIKKIISYSKQDEIN